MKNPLSFLARSILYGSRAPPDAPDAGPTNSPSSTSSSAAPHGRVIGGHGKAAQLDHRGHHGAATGPAMHGSPRADSGEHLHGRDANSASSHRYGAHPGVAISTFSMGATSGSQELDPRFVHQPSCPHYAGATGSALDSAGLPDSATALRWRSHSPASATAMTTTSLPPCRCRHRVDFSAALPVELALYLLGFLDAASLTHLAACSRYLHALCSDPGVWRDMYRANPRWAESVLASHHGEFRILATLGAHAASTNPAILPVALPAPPAAAAAPAPRLVHQPHGTTLSFAHFAPLAWMGLPSPPSSPTKPTSQHGNYIVIPHQQHAATHAHDAFFGFGAGFSPPHQHLEDADGDAIMTGDGYDSASETDSDLTARSKVSGGARSSGSHTPRAAAFSAHHPRGGAAFGAGAGGKLVVRGPPPTVDWKYLYRNRVQLDRNWATHAPAQTVLRGHADSVYCIQFDRHLLVSGSRDQTIKVWSMKSGVELRSFRGHSGSVLCLQYEGSTLVTGSSDSTVMVWDLHTGAHQCTLAGHLSGVLDVAYSGEWIVSCSKDATIKVWSRVSRAGAPPKYALASTLSGHRAAVNAIQLRGGTLVSASGDYLLKVWDVRTGRHVRDLVGHGRGIACVAFDGDLVVSGSNDQTIRVWDVHSGRCLQVLQGHVDLVRTLALDTPRGLVVSGSYDQTVKVWELAPSVMAHVADTRKRHANDKAAKRAAERKAKRVPVPPPLPALPPSVVAAAAEVPSTPSAAATTAATATTTTPVAQGPIPVGRPVHSFDTAHSSWVFNVGVSATHIVSASQDQTIVVYDFTRDVDTVWTA
ncbi:hypothetical protein H9P43_009970 [Blastocladiella emersonii ATCC 22665]|nr:hypothetical protein H9P43_009970 [Blastocladiella emersonii ATCC 22665]